MTKNSPQRRCIACMTSYPQELLVRMTIKDGNIAIDQDKRNDGRGVYICRKKECIERAFKRNSFRKTCRCNLDEEMLKELKNELSMLIEEVNNVKENQ